MEESRRGVMLNSMVRGLCPGLDDDDDDDDDDHDMTYRQ